MFKNKGFTLIEFLVAIVILMVGILGLLQTVNVAINHNLNSQIRNEAVSVADWYMSKELSKSFDLVSTTPSNTLVNRKILNGFKNFSVQRTGTTLSNSKQVNYVVKWKHKNATYTHETNSVVSKHQ